MKKINLFIVAIVAMLGFTINAKAEISMSLKCADQRISIGGSTTCTVSFSGATTPINTAEITISKSETIDVTDISNVTANTTAGWKYVPSTAASSVYSFQNTAGVTSGEIFSFRLTINEKAKELGKDDNCGEICIGSATFNKTITSTGTKSTGTCFAPVVIEEPQCEGPDCNPQTGSFANYAIIAVSILVAGAAVIIARKSSKFFRV